MCDISKPVTMEGGGSPPSMGGHPPPWWVTPLHGGSPPTMGGHPPPGNQEEGNQERGMQRRRRRGPGAEECSAERRQQDNTAQTHVPAQLRKHRRKAASNRRNSRALHRLGQKTVRPPGSRSSSGTTTNAEEQEKITHAHQTQQTGNRPTQLRQQKVLQSRPPVPSVAQGEQDVGGTNGEATGLQQKEKRTGTLGTTTTDGKSGIRSRNKTCRCTTGTCDG